MALIWFMIFFLFKVKKNKGRRDRHKLLYFRTPKGIDQERNHLNSFESLILKAHTKGEWKNGMGFDNLYFNDISSSETHPEGGGFMGYRGSLDLRAKG